MLPVMYMVFWISCYTIIKKKKKKMDIRIGFCSVWFWLELIRAKDFSNTPAW